MSNLTKKIRLYKFRVFLLMFFYGQLFFSCNQKLPIENELKVKWQIVDNQYAETPKVKSIFTIENNSQFSFDNKNWAMFYNQSPRKPLSSGGNVRIEHISGDWFKMSPTDKFSLKPLQTIEIEYECSDWLIKECDAPLGLYFVFYDKKGNEAGVVPLSDYSVGKFDKPEHVTRHKMDSEPLSNAENNFTENENLSLLPPNKLLPIIPSPKKYASTGKKVEFNEPIKIGYEKGLENEAYYILGFLKRMFDADFELNVANKPTENSLFLSLNPGKVKESYRLEVRKNKSLIIEGTDAAGVFYGLQSLISMLPVELFLGKEVPVVLDEVVIEDSPRFGYRGLHLDVARNFQTKESILKAIDIMAYYKCNYLFFYVTEDEGWRLAIEELPELTDIGGKRGHTSKEANELHPSYGSGPVANAKNSHGRGFYSREDFKEILKYAKSRHVKIIPEVNFPGHSRAAIKAMEARYDRFIKEGNSEKANEFRLIDPDDKSEYLSAQWYTDNIVCVARESVYKFYETVIDDIIEMYKEAEVELEFFHTGGDEVPEGAWAKSPLCIELMKSLPEIKDAKNLQAWFFKRAVEILNLKNLKIGGWEEVALLKDETGKYVANPEFAGKNVYPYVWNNLGRDTDLAYRMANAGYPVILCNVSNFYFDLAYNNDPREPGLYWAGFVNARDAWQVAPYKMFYTTTHTSMGKEMDAEDYKGLETLKPEAIPNILGLEAHLWSETIKGSDMLQYYFLPKLIGFSESAWSPERKWEKIPDKVQRTNLMNVGWNIFANTLAQKELPKLSALFGGYNYYIPAPGGKITEGKLVINSAYPGLIVRYTTDGTDPTLSSPVWKEPVPVTGKVTIRAFDAAGKASKTYVL